MKQVSEFLTGRIAVVELSPFAFKELPNKPIDDLWLIGGFPYGGILKREQYPQWQRKNLELLAMRDLPVWGLPATAPVTRRFFKMSAASHGSAWYRFRILSLYARVKRSKRLSHLISNGYEITFDF